MPVSKRETFGAQQIEAPNVTEIKRPKKRSINRPKINATKDISQQLKERLKSHIPRQRVNQPESNKASNAFSSSALTTQTNISKAGVDATPADTERNDGYSRSFTALVESGLVPTNEADLTASIAELLGEQADLSSITNEAPIVEQTPVADQTLDSTVNTVVDIALDDEFPEPLSKPAKDISLETGIAGSDLIDIELAESKIPAKFVDESERAIELMVRSPAVKPLQRSDLELVESEKSSTSVEPSEILDQGFDADADDNQSTAMVQSATVTALKVKVVSHHLEPSTMASAIDISDDMLSAYSNLPPNTASRPRGSLYRLWRSIVAVSKKVISLPAKLFRRRGNRS